MQELVSGIASLSGVIEKGGIVGVMLIATAFLGWWCMKLRKQLALVFRQRDFARAVQFRYKGALDNAKLTVDISDIEKLFEKDRLEEIA